MIGCSEVSISFVILVVCSVKFNFSYIKGKVIWRIMKTLKELFQITGTSEG